MDQKLHKELKDVVLKHKLGEEKFAEFKEYEAKYEKESKAIQRKVVDFLNTIPQETLINHGPAIIDTIVNKMVNSIVTKEDKLKVGLTLGVASVNSLEKAFDKLMSEDEEDEVDDE